MSNPTPILILSDAPSSTTGLGRITRDLASRLARMPEFRVGTLGYGGPGSRDLPWPQYNIHSIDGWLVPELPDVWADFAGGERGVLLTIWDPSRLRWLAQPQALDARGQPLCPALLAAWLRARPFQLWGYVPVDASGPNGMLTAQIKDALRGYDRLLAYSEWAAGVMDATLDGNAKFDDGVRALPHGINTGPQGFQPHPRGEAKARFRQLGFDGLTDDAFLVGMVATNQARKDFGLGMEVCARLLAQGLNVRVWVHTDVYKRHWDLLALLEDFGLLGRCVITTTRFTDEQMSWLYAACDVTLGIGLGEGFGYPIFESLASGTPCIHGNYGGAAEHLPAWYQVGAKSWRLEGQYNCLRPVFDPADWTACVNALASTYAVAKLPPQLDWAELWPRWADWFRQGVGK